MISEATSARQKRALRILAALLAIGFFFAAPHYAAVMESYQKAQDVAKQAR